MRNVSFALLLCLLALPRIAGADTTAKSSGGTHASVSTTSSQPPQPPHMTAEHVAQLDAAIMHQQKIAADYNEALRKYNEETNKALEPYNRKAADVLKLYGIKPEDLGKTVIVDFTTGEIKRLPPPSPPSKSATTSKK